MRRGGGFLLALAVGGCFYVGKEQAEDVLQKPVTQWSSRDCLTVLLSSMRNNLFDQRCPNVKVIATPYTPAVIAAINRMKQEKEHWSDAETQQQIETALTLQAGLYFDGLTNQLFDSRGNSLRSTTQLDRFQFLLTLRNNSWPCTPPMQTFGVGGTIGHITMPLARLGDWPCYIPGITDLDDRILLQNDKGVTLKPEHVWGRRNNILSTEETLVVLFDLKQGEGRFFEDTRNAYLIITGFDAAIRLSFPVSAVNPSLSRFARESDR
jgi:hypothetical protein